VWGGRGKREGEKRKEKGEKRREERKELISESFYIIKIIVFLIFNK
jgi:hypothetical protein